MIQELDKVVHQWCDDNDRWMYIEYDRDGMVMGLNFMQGDEYECFKKSWCVSDKGLTAFYKQMLYTFAYEQKNVPEPSLRAATSSSAEHGQIRRRIFVPRPGHTVSCCCRSTARPAGQQW